MIYTGQYDLQHKLLKKIMKNRDSNMNERGGEGKEQKSLNVICNLSKMIKIRMVTGVQTANLLIPQNLYIYIYICYLLNMINKI